MRAYPCQRFKVFASSKTTSLQPWNIRYFASEVVPGLYEAIKNAKEDQTEGLIRLEGEHQWPTGTELGMQLFVRECYPGMFSLVKQLEERKEGGGGGVVFTGNPGIGKSWWLNYALWNLLQEDKTVLVESVRKNTVWLFKDKQVLLARKPDDQVDLIGKVRSDPHAWYLFDPAGKTPREPETILPFTIVAASPNPQHYKEFFKLVGKKYYVPCWSLEELKKHYPHAAQTSAKGLTEQQVVENFNLFGGITRYVYKTGEDLEFMKKELDVALNNLDLSALSLVQKSLEIVERLQDRISHKLVQYEVDPKTFLSLGIRFASNYVIDQVHKLKAESHLSAVGKALHDLKGGSVAGTLFQPYAASLLSEGGRFRIYSLEDGTKGWLTMPPRTETPYVGMVSALKKWDQIKSEEFLKCAPNFPLIDALSSEGLFNYTVSSTHSFNIDRCKELLARLEPNKRLRFYWVVRDGDGLNFRKPTVKESDSQKEEGVVAEPRSAEEQQQVIEVPSPLAERIEQFTLEIPTFPYDEMDIVDLKHLCKKKGLKLTGSKGELLSRLKGLEEAD